jgi:hypothetical protein
VCALDPPWYESGTRMRFAIRLLTLAAVALACAWARPALADCTTDTDCPGPFCGSEVCQYTVSGHSCVPAGTDPQGFDGWCSIDVNCKCAGQGATCDTALGHCTFTVPQDAAAGSADSGGSPTTTAATPASCAVGSAAGRRGRPEGALAFACALAALGVMARRRRNPTRKRCAQKSTLSGSRRRA